jgi:hypothetical protein
VQSKDSFVAVTLMRLTLLADGVTGVQIISYESGIFAIFQPFFKTLRAQGSYTLAKL